MSAAADASGTIAIPPVPRPSSMRGWVVFALSFALLLSDYMSRQVLAAVYPQLKAQWLLSDARLGALSGVVALMVGVLTVPLSLASDRIGRARSVAIMAFTWSFATLACAACANYGQMLAARLVLGVGEAAYGSVGLAIVFSYFPRTLRATITGVFMAGGLFGSFIGLSVGGALAAQLGWRGAFAGMAAIGLVLATAYMLVVRDGRASPEGQVKDQDAQRGARAIAVGLFGSPSVVLTYIASGLQLFVLGSLMAWTPSYLNRFQHFSPQAGAIAAAVLLLAAGVGMAACGGLADRVSARRPHLRPRLAAAYGLVTFIGLEMALHLPPGGLQLGCALIGLFCAGGASGPAGAIVADRTPAALHGAALAVLTLSNNVLGLAPGPVVTGMLADKLGLQTALQITPVAALAAAAVFWLSGSISRPTQQSRP